MHLHAKVVAIFRCVQFVSCILLTMIYKEKSVSKVSYIF